MPDEPVSYTIFGGIVADPKGLDTRPGLDAGLLRWTDEGVRIAWSEARKRQENWGKELVAVAKFRIQKEG